MKKPFELFKFFLLVLYFAIDVTIFECYLLLKIHQNKNLAQRLLSINIITNKIDDL